MSRGSRLPWQAAAAAALALLAVVVIWTAWMSDDAFITLRTIDNFWNGYGLRWNPIERVQSYTHPLWMLLMGAAYGITREGHLTVIALSFACTAGAVALLFSRLPLPGATLALVMLASSRAFTDYTTSGLENPLSHLLLVAFWLTVLTDTPASRGSSREPSRESSRERLFRLALFASLGMLTRLDLALLMAPGLLVEGRRLPWRRTLLPLAGGAVPLVLWHLFTLLYYGFPFPNTAYAKLGTGLPSSMLMDQGLLYLRESLESDAVTLVTAGAAIVVGLRRPTAASAALAGGILLHLVYVVRAGGDFMAGRFLTPAFVCAVVLLAARLPARWPRLVPVAAAAALLGSLAQAASPLLRPVTPLPLAPDRFIRSANGIVDERVVHYTHTGLIPVMQGVRLTDHMWANGGRRHGVPHVAPAHAVGLYGYFSGPAIQVVDRLALSDPLLARLPLAAGSSWRIGHFEREVPAGYEETLAACVRRLFPGGALRVPATSCRAYWNEINRFRDPAIAHRYHELLRITQDPLLDPDRLWTIARWNLGLSGFGVDDRGGSSGAH